MSKLSRSRLYLKVLRYVTIILLTIGFAYQTLQFLELYWTYPTVVDIQESSPTFLEVPAFTFCNRVGYKYENLCKGFRVKACGDYFFTAIAAPIICKSFSYICDNDTLPEDFKTIVYTKFMQRYALQREDFPRFAKPLSDYLKCTIEYEGKSTQCNMENVLGSFYTIDDFPQFCYTIYSKWGEPEKKREIIPKGAKMKFHMFLNYSNRAPDENGNYVSKPMHNPNCYAVVQMAVHSPYFLPSPYLTGSSYYGGRNYELRIKQSESHLLPAPYQTNCTDYLSSWEARKGKAPINQLTVIQECRINKTYEELGCIPVTMDYPHPYNLCISCYDDQSCPYREPQNNCSLLAEDFNQACDSMKYEVQKEGRNVVELEKIIDSSNPEKFEVIKKTLPMHDCEGRKGFEYQCSEINIDIPFDQFEIKKTTYNAKYESLEVFSVVGGYMGMWMGFSFLTISEETVNVGVAIASYITKRSKKLADKLKATLDTRKSPADLQRDLTVSHI